MELEKISIIVPVYQAEHTLERCLNSIINQSYQNLEIIVVDDGSTDDSASMIARFAALDKRIRPIYQSNAGVSSARNAGLRIAQGTWIGFVDSDDFIERDMYTYLHNLAKKSGSDLSQCGVFWDDLADKHLCYNTFDGCVQMNESNMVALLLDHFSNWVHNKLFHKNLVSTVEFPVQCSMGEDVFFNLSTCFSAQKIFIGQRPMYHYVQIPTSLCNVRPDRKRLVEYWNILDFAMDTLKGNPVAVEYIKIKKYEHYLDICAKIVCHKIMDGEDLIFKLRSDISRNIVSILKNKNLSAFQKCKLSLLCCSWSGYRGLISLKKARNM